MYYFMRRRDRCGSCGNAGGRHCHHRPDGTQVAALNDLLHQYGRISWGAWVYPYREKGVNIISVAMDAPGDVISALSGKLGRLEGVTAKTVYAPAGSV